MKEKTKLPEIVPMPEGKPQQSQSLLGYSVLVEFTLKDGSIKQGFYLPKTNKWREWATDNWFLDKNVVKWQNCPCTHES